MRSRYSAYALNLPDYIIATTHPASPQYRDDKFSWKRSISRFSREFSFQRLEILDFKERDTIATVTFTAHLTEKDNDATYTEKSSFEKIKNQWLYRAGQIAEGHAPNLVTTSPLRLLPLAYYGNPILRKKADPIPAITDDIIKLVEEMIETMDASDGIGIAAPQVHHSIRLFVIRTPIVTEKNHIEPGAVQVFINPTLSSPSTDTWEAPEGCLSIPSLRASIARPKEITISYTSLNGTFLEKKCSGWEAKVISHEYDHIEGILFIDHLSPKELAKFTPFLLSLEKRLHDGLAL